MLLHIERVLTEAQIARCRAILEDAKLLRRPLALWDRAAFVTDRDVLTGIAVAFGGLVPGEFQVFPLSKRDEAIAWVAEGAQSRA